MGMFTDITDTVGLTNYGEQKAMVQSARDRFAGLTPPELKELELEQVGLLQLSAGVV